MAHLPRWAIAKTIRQQSVAEHSYFVTQLARRVASEIFPHERVLDVILWALDHDVDETLSGDVANPALVNLVDGDGARYKKWMEFHMEERMPWLSKQEQWTPITVNIVRFVDVLESLCFLAEEMKMGNTEVARLFTAVVEYMPTLIAKFSNKHEELEDFAIDTLTDILCRNDEVATFNAVVTKFDSLLSPNGSFETREWEKRVRLFLGARIRQNRRNPE